MDAVMAKCLGLCDLIAKLIEGVGTCPDRGSVMSWTPFFIPAQ